MKTLYGLSDMLPGGTHGPQRHLASNHMLTFHVSLRGVRKVRDFDIAQLYSCILDRITHRPASKRFDVMLRQTSEWGHANAGKRRIGFIIDDE